jgi:CBS domain-containing protein
MSRTREGRDKESNEAARQQAESQPVTDTAGQAGGTRQHTYIPGRESAREFPRRSTSLRERDVSESRDLYSSRREDLSRQGRTVSYRKRPGDTGWSSREFERRPEGRTSYDAYGREPESYYESRGRLSGRYEDRERYERGRREGRTSGAYDRGYDYDREQRRQRSFREDYDEPYQREMLSGRYGYEQEYWPARPRPGVGRYTGEADFRPEERRERSTGYYGRNYLRCSDIMTKDVTVCSRQTSIRDIAEKMEDDNVGSIPVVENGRLVGIVTDRDIVCRVLAEGLDSHSTTAVDAMSEDIITCAPEERVVEAIRKMGEHQIRRIPVCDVNGRLRGIISMADVALEAERDRELAESLEEISQPLPNRSRRV